MNALLHRGKQFTKTAWFRYGLAVGITVVATVVRAYLHPLLGELSSYTTYYPAIAILAMFVGIGPVFLAIALSFLAATYWFVPPYGSFRVFDQEAHTVGSLIFLVACILIGLAGEISRSARVQLHRTRKLFETFLDNSPGLTFLKDDSGRYVYANKALTERYNAQFLGKTDFDLFPDHMAIQFREHELISLWENKPQEFIETTREADGEHTWISIKFPVIDGEGRRLLGGKSLDITRRTRAEAEVARLQRERAVRDAAELEAMTRLHHVGLLCQSEGTTQQECLDAILDAAIFITAADKGNLQLYDAEANTLRFAVYRGFQKPFLEFFSDVREVAASCGYAFRQSQRTIVQDVTTSEIFAGTPSLEVLLAENVHAVQSTPLVSGQGRVLGVFSTHFVRQHCPDERQLRLLDLLARQAADYLERKQAEAELKGNEERLRLASQAAQFGTYYADFLTRTRYWSPELRAIVGLGPDASTGDFESIPDFIHPDDRGRVAEKMRACHDPGGSGIIEDEHRIVLPDGKVRWVMMKGCAFFEGEGEGRRPVRATGVVLDITRRKRADADRAQLAAIVESSEDAIYIYNFEGTVRSWNCAAEKLFGWRAEEIVGQPAERILPADLKSEVGERLIPGVKRGETFAGFETRRMRKDGSVFDALITASPLRNLSGEPVAVSIIARDISERKRFEETLRDLAAQLKNFLDSVPTGITRCSRDLRYLSANPAYAKLAGLPLDQIVGRPVIDVMGMDGWEAIRPHVERVLAGERVEYEAAVPFSAAGSRTLHVVYTPERNADGEVVGWIASVSDITEFSGLQNRLRKMEKLAAAGQLTASLAHEINNPLSTIVDAFYVLRGQPGLDTDGKMVVDMADAEVARLSRIVKQSLSYYRAGSAIKDVDVAALVEQSLDVFSGILSGAGIEVKQKLTFGISIPGCPDEIRQVIDNLLLNAAEATPKGGRIVVSVRKSRSWKNGTQFGVRLTVADDGCGIPQELLGNIFELFFTTKSEKGTGFGLWVVNSLVSKHDGVIRIRSSQRAGKSGSVFSILFPSNENEPGVGAQVESQTNA